ncbi:MAG: hypothetical protein ACRDP6_36655 [Actinoallomurus sp.]
MSFTRRFDAEESHLRNERMRAESMHPRSPGPDDKTPQEDSGTPPSRSLGRASDDSRSTAAEETRCSRPPSALLGGP